MLVAKECQHMAKNAPGGDSQAFQKGAMIMMGAMVFASVGGVILQLYRELKGKEEHGRYR
jgi:hypothetical protein